jgi:phosphate transport system substrate-binding protein
MRVALVATLALSLAACRPAIAPDSPLGARVSLIGAGASFPALLYQSWAISLYQAMPELRVNYQSLGSGAGVEQLIDQTIDFGASDVAMTDDELAQVEAGVLLLPMTAGSIVLAYNLPQLEAPLRLSRQTYSKIFLGQITTWNDPKIVADNPGLTLPDLPITVVHRSDGSGTTAVLTAHLSEINRSWKTLVGIGKSIDWPDTGRFIGGKGNEGVTVQILQTQGAIGYLEYSYAMNNTLPMAALENKSGYFVRPSNASATATLTAVQLPANLRAFITDPEGVDSYPIVTYTWLLACQHYDDPLKAKAVELFVDYGLNQGQAVAPALGYVPLPQAVRQQVAALADGISGEYTIAVK